MKKRISILGPAYGYIQGKLKESEQGILKAQLEIMQSGDFRSIRTKRLKGKIHELIFGSHRITYFLLEQKIYLVRGFRKKSNKTPKKEIEYAEKIYKILNQ
jgi:phage-related protein